MGMEKFQTNQSNPPTIKHTRVHIKLEILNNSRGFVLFPRNCAVASSLKKNFARPIVMFAWLRVKSNVH